MIVFLLITGNVFSQKHSKNQQEVQLLADNIFHLSEVMLHDVAAPVAASRFYAYAMLGAYETAHYGTGRLVNLNEELNANPEIKPPVLPKNFNVSLASNYALLHVGRFIMPSGAMLEEKQKALVAYFKKKKKISESDIKDNIRYAEEIAKSVLAYARTDGYNKLSTYTRYSPSKKEGYWYPTPPEYMSAVEPQWKTIRTFFLDSAKQFAPPPPVAYSKDSTSAFYKLMLEVYEAKNNITKEQLAIANFWDCNPFAVDYSGHMAIGLKKISPAGHWMGITSIACKKADISLDSAILIHSMVALTLHDAFISCWQEKYFSDRIRPESAINILIDPSWRPVLQTPPFPEYTSGHSVASSSVAVVLTYLLGDNFNFLDTSEMYFGIPAREFKSFYQAAEEAAISRLYGGIHFRDACENGVVQGKQIGQFILSNMVDLQAKQN
ncbi:vanadium-dependent haloperoxidase [Chryseolinea sp. H1M3-3]|uniref:vanadium-dependent haloperoxidase n=1 Tax=Chryseolinea sp. H1M3-3 TaxID=3034144 RepID=UPI0023EB51B4|nr:vanadium-dependent haloperoxidase [Chryseolinea sp. H1M3-3]